MPAFVLATIVTTNFSNAQPSGYAVTQRGADWRVLSKTTVENGTNRVVKYTELATGLNYQNSYGQWTESQEHITILPTGGASATQGRHQVYFPADIYNGVLEVVTPDGRHLKSRPLGISYDDGSNTVFIATLKSAQGYLTSSNTVTYRDAFTGFKADLVCTYRRGGFECDLVFRQQPPTPGDYGLDDTFATLQLVTEFFNTQDPQEIPAGYDDWYGLQDRTLKFGKLTMTRGKAFAFKGTNSISPRSLGGEGQGEGTIPVYKSWVHAAGRTFLIETVPLLDISDNLDALPLTASVRKLGSLIMSISQPAKVLMGVNLGNGYEDHYTDWDYLSGGNIFGDSALFDQGDDDHDVSWDDALPSGLDAFSTVWENATVQETFNEVTPYYSSYQGYYGTENLQTQTRVMITPAGQQAIGQNAIYLVAAQVMDEDSGLQLAAEAVKFMHQLAGTLTEDVTNDDGSVWSQALVSAPAGVQAEVTPMAAGNISFAGMKISPSRIVYISVDPNNLPTTFDAHAVQTNLQSELSTNVFDSPPAGKSVQIKVHVDKTWNGQFGWSNPKFTYVNRVDWKLNAGNNIASSGGSPGNLAGGETSINPTNVMSYCVNHGGFPTAQTWVNILAHEVIWLNASSQFDQNSNPDGDISKGENVPAFAAYTVLSASRLTIRSHFGF